MTVQSDLSEARRQYHNLVTGQATRVFVDQNGERVEFVSANKSDLLAYITSLEGQLGCGPTPAANRPARFVF